MNQRSTKSVIIQQEDLSQFLVATSLHSHPNGTVLVICKILLRQFLSYLHVLRPPDSEKNFFLKNTIYILRFQLRAITFVHYPE